MPPFTSPNSDTHQRCPAERISQGVWLDDRFCLSSRDVDELRFARGVMVTYDAIRQWGQKFGQASANQLRRRHPRRGDKWHLEAVFLPIRGERPSRWRAVDPDGEVLDSLGQRWRDQKAAKRCFHTLLKGCQDAPRGIITDQLKSSGAATRELFPGVEHRQPRDLHHRAENSPQPPRQRERRRQGFKSPGQAQRFLAA